MISCNKKERFESIIDVLKLRSIEQADKIAYRFLVDGEDLEETITYSDLDRKAQILAATIQTHCEKGDRAILLYSPGLDFIIAYFACLYAGIIAIPFPPPHHARLLKTIDPTINIIRDAKPKILLSNSKLINSIKQQLRSNNDFSLLHMISTDTLEKDAHKAIQPVTGINRSDVAFLQYTSGSTSSPKGVMVSYDNLLNNLEYTERRMCTSENSSGVFWLPFYHDMGLIGGILQPLYSGFTSTLIPHLLFLQKPLRWLKAMTKYKATVTAAPNFAYDLCNEKINEANNTELDLSQLKTALNGAEPVNPSTIINFFNSFKACGFKLDAFVPCYGLAESTLMVSGGPIEEEPIIKHLDKTEFQNNKLQFSDTSSDNTISVVSCGEICDGQTIKIVNPSNLNECTSDCIGEIWINGPSVTVGYWNNQDATEETFRAKLENDSLNYLRTGDLGFISDGQLFITGRIKNMIIIDGKNYYPHDIQRVVENAHYAINPSGSAVFAIDDSKSEQIVVLAEFQHKLVNDVKELEDSIRSAVSESLSLDLFDVRFVIPGSIPRTTSGKIKHHACKEQYLNENLKELNLS